jgi:hypothetical protein
MIIRNKFNGYAGDGRRLYPGGGGGQQQPTNTTQTTTTIPEYARPTVERMIGRAEAYSKTPYQAYGGQRIAEFTPLQQKSFESAENLGPAGQIGAGTQMAGIAGIQGLGAGQRYAQQATSPGAMNAYMSPYTQMALEPQMREAARRSAMEGQVQQAQAAQRGAFGGSRSALMEAERQRNLGQLQSDIYGKGMQTAFEQARQAQQFGADLGLRGAGMGLQAAGTLGQLGQTQFGQEEAAMRAQSAAGAQQQQLNQQKLSQAYQDFLSQRGYEQQQLSFLSDMLRGTPLSQTSYQQFQAAPPLTSQVAQLGLGAYGISQLGKGGFFKEGGIVKGYAEGGVPEGGIADAAPQPQGSVPNTMDINKLRAALDRMSDEQLEMVKESASDATTFALAQEQQTLNARLRNAKILSESIPDSTIKDEMIAADRGADSGIAAAPLPETMFGDTAVGEREEMPEMARGGIVAFAKGNKVEAKPDDIAALRAMDPTKALRTEAERGTDIATGLAELEKYLGPDKSVEIAERLAKSSEISPESEAMSKAGAAFEAMAAFGEPGTFASGFGKAGAIIGRNVKELDKLKRDAKREADKLRLDTARYERLDKRGNYAEAQKVADRIAGRQEKLYSLDLAQKNTLADIQMKQEKMAQDLQIAREGFAVQRAGQTDVNRQALGNYIEGAVADFTKANGRNPNPQEMAQLKRMATESYAKTFKVDPYAGLRAGASAANVIQDEIKEIDAALKGAALGMPLPEGTTVATLQARRADAEKRYKAALGGGGAQPAPSASAAGSAKPQPGQIFTDANGNRAKYVGGDPKDPKSYQPV